MIEVEGIKYNLEKNYKDAFVKEEFSALWTDYFKEFDYVANLEKYLEDFCAYECRYFVLKRID